MFVPNTQDVDSIFSTLLSANRFVVSEMSGTAQERAKFSGGLVFVDPGELAETCRYYLQQPELRAAIASRGRQLFEQQVEADILRRPVEAMLGERENGQREARQTA